MKRAQGSINAEPIVCLNPVRGLWRVRLGITPTDDGAEWQEHDFDHRPTADEVRNLFTEWVNSEVADKIREGLEYEGCMVWLSTENQLNYRSALDVAVQTDGANLPLRVKLGTDSEPVFKEFCSVESLQAFVTACALHVQHCLEEGWQRKAAFDVEPYLRE